ncbi:MAG: alpha/beta hydrolase [Candidatus Eremiobacteraeota bacterium]|nr:alpha/beta hydrolase [Candidatus Eremiobacteraeota bacterium]
MPSSRSQVVNYLLKNVVKPFGRSGGRGPDVAWVRASVARAARLAVPIPGVVVRPSRLADLPGEWVESLGGRATRTILYFHGGGYFFGSPTTHRSLTRPLAKLSGCRVFALRYRLAPEFPFPAAHEDALAAYLGLLEAGEDPHEIVLAGDSAGGGLALSTLVALRDRGLPLPAAVVCFSPWTDLAATGRSLDTNDAHCAMFYGADIATSARLYAGQASPEHPLISPLYADLGGLPPMLVHVSDSEVLLDDSTRLAERAKQAGVRVELAVWKSLPHVWQLFSPLMPEARRSLVQAADFIDRHTRRHWVPPYFTF